MGDMSSMARQTKTRNSLINSSRQNMGGSVVGLAIYTWLQGSSEISIFARNVYHKHQTAVDDGRASAN